MNDDKYYVGESMASLTEGLTNEDIIEGMEEKSIEEIIREVAEEEGMSEKEVEEAIHKLSKFNFNVKEKKRLTKPKRDKAKEKAKKKIANKSRKRNR